MKVLNSSKQDGISCDLGRRSPAGQQDIEHAVGMWDTCDILKANHMCNASGSSPPSRYCRMTRLGVELVSRCGEAACLRDKRKRDFRWPESSLQAQLTCYCAYQVRADLQGYCNGWRSFFTLRACMFLQTSHLLQARPQPRISLECLGTPSAAPKRAGHRMTAQ